MKNRLRVQRFLSVKREQRRLNKLADKRAKRLKASRGRDEPLVFLPNALNILQKNLPEKYKWTKDKRSETIKVPRTFSIIDDTEHALDTVYQLVSYTKRRRPPREIYFDHSELEKFDLTAEEILDVVALEFRRARRRAKGGLRLGGRLPIDEQANRFIRAVGIIKNLDLSSYYLGKDEEGDLRILRSISKKRLLRLGEESVTEEATRRLVEYVNECLEIDGMELTDVGVRDLANYAGEVLDNASEHSGTEDWVLVGYLDPSSEERQMEIAIFNFGKTYSQTFLELPNDHYTMKFVDPFVKLHERRGFFHTSWAPESLLTVVALQGQVSSKNNSKFDTRGNGTIDLIQFFQEMHESIGSRRSDSARMAIISGKTKILFDGKHTLAADRAGRAIIAFNSKNSLELPPNNTHVRTLGGTGFPGTIVSIRFPLTREVTQEVKDHNER